MSGQGSGSTQSYSSGNAPQASQAPQQPQPQQPDLMFDRGRALFARLQADQVQEYTNFKKLKDVQMISQINDLQYWRNRNGPQNQDETQSSRIFLQNLKDLKQLQARRIIKLPGFLIELKRLCQVGLGWRSQQQRQLAKKKEKTVSCGQEYSLSQSYGIQYNLSDGAEAEQEEKMPLNKKQ